MVKIQVINLSPYELPKYQTDNQEEQYVDHISVDKIIPNKNQPRQIFVENGMNELIDSIKENGILQPLTVRDLKDGTYVSPYSV